MLYFVAEMKRYDKFFEEQSETASLKINVFIVLNACTCVLCSYGACLLNVLDWCKLFQASYKYACAYKTVLAFSMYFHAVLQFFIYK